MDILYFLLNIIIGLSGIILILSFLPWMISLNGNIIARDEKFSAHGKIHVGSKKFGIAGTTERKIHIGPFQNPWFRITVKKKSKQGEKPKKILRSGKNSPMPFVRPALNSLQWNQVALSGDFGLKNPADTGIIFGGIQACKGWIRSPKIHLDITPVFSHRLYTDLTGSFRFRCIPAVLVWNLSKTYLHFRSKKG